VTLRRRGSKASSSRKTFDHISIQVAAVPLKLWRGSTKSPRVLVGKDRCRQRSTPPVNSKIDCRPYNCQFTYCTVQYSTELQWLGIYLPSTAVNAYQTPYQFHLQLRPSSFCASSIVLKPLLQSLHQISLLARVILDLPLRQDILQLRHRHLAQFSQLGRFLELLDARRPCWLR